MRGIKNKLFIARNNKLNNLLHGIEVVSETLMKYSQN